VVHNRVRLPFPDRRGEIEVGAGEGNRTLVVSLGRGSSGIEPHARAGEYRGGPHGWQVVISMEFPTVGPELVMVR
jgi:hypothetical protein